MLIKDASSDARFASHPGLTVHGIKSYIAVPLNRRDGSYFGTLCALDPLPAELTDDSFKIFHLLASLIAFELEADDSERRSRAAAEQVAEQGRELARLEERERIAMDLHDGVIQSLYGVVLRLGASELNSDRTAQPAEVNLAINRLNDIIQEIRRNIFNLRLRDLGEGGLREGIERLAEELRVYTFVRARIQLRGGTEGSLTRDTLRSLLYIAREATSNVIRHAGATMVTIRVVHSRDHLVMSIRDNGRGFDETRRLGGLGNGLPNIAERARRIGGAATIVSTPGVGTDVRIRLPFQL